MYSLIRDIFELCFSKIIKGYLESIRMQALKILRIVNHLIDDLLSSGVFTVRNGISSRA